jgi:hypothetical protein
MKRAIPLLVATALLSACATPAETEVRRVGGAVFEPFPDGTPVELIAAPAFPDAGRRRFKNVEIGEPAPDAELIGVGRYGRTPGILVWPIDYRRTKRAIRQAARDLGGDLVRFREAACGDDERHGAEGSSPGGFHCGYFEVYRKKP